ncbi:MAG: carboxypeptidase regulatory-like domain-containing protein [Chloroflexi bacterium]|nr:MAG: carboxypeptidase regulatory-like domain-containing protein [Chloroflexota bacterium]
MPSLSDIVVYFMSFRLLFAALAVALVAVALLVWQPWTGQLKGTVYLTACGGTEPANPPPGYKNCNTTVAAGAQVTASPAAGGSSTQAVADSSGRYQLRLMAGQYYLWGVTTRPSQFRGQRRLVQVSANTTLHIDVDVALYAA